MKLLLFKSPGLRAILRGLAAIAGVCLLQITAQAQDPGDSSDPQAVDPRAPLSASIDFGSSHVEHPGKGGQKFEQIGINPHAVVSVTVQYPVGMAGQAIVAESLDGGRIIVRGQDLIIDDQGQLSFGFQAGDPIGYSRITLYNGESIQTLQFWVNDLSHPDQNP